MNTGDIAKLIEMLKRQHIMLKKQHVHVHVLYVKQINEQATGTCRYHAEKIAVLKGQVKTREGEIKNLLEASCDRARGTSVQFPAF